MKEFFADSYAIMAGLRGDPYFGPAIREGRFRTGLLNLMEAHFGQVRSGRPPSVASEALRPFEAIASTPTWPLLQAASRLRLKLRSAGRQCSFIDAVGYAEAQERQIPFLTGYEAFKGLPGVLFRLALTN